MDSVDEKIELLARYIEKRGWSVWTHEHEDLNHLHDIEMDIYRTHRYSHPKGFSGANLEAIKSVLSRVLKDS
jgi:hypothetical protein